MSEVKRYGHQQYNGKIWLDEREDGKFCSYDDYANLKEERDALAALAEERRQFIVNGVEMGDILLPVIDGDPAIGIHERCLLKPKFAYDAYLNSLRAEGVDYVAEAIGEKCAELKIGSKDWKALKSIVFMLGDFSSKLRAGDKS